nr:cytochrome c oxidase subunit II [Nothopoda sp.]
MMVWNNLYFNFPSSIGMEYIMILMDYTIMILIFVLIMSMLQLTNNFFTKNLNHTLLVHHELEMIWSIIPFIILVFILIPTLMSLYMLESCNFCGITVKIMGHQWYWSYFNEDKKIYFMSYMEQSFNYLRLLEVDNSLVLPYGVPIRLLISSMDVIHSWTIPSMGVKMDAIPGRINSLCFSCNKMGKFFGQCSEICGVNHSFMPISLEIINLKDYIMI